MHKACDVAYFHKLLSAICRQLVTSCNDSAVRESTIAAMLMWLCVVGEGTSVTLYKVGL